MEPLVHALIPLVFLLAVFPKLDKKYIFLLVPIVWIIDLDTYFGQHRFTLHNIFFVLLVAALLYVLWDKMAGLVGFFYGFSHLLLDSFYPGPAWLYPFVDRTFYITSQVLRDGEWIVNLGWGSLALSDYVAFAETVGPSRYIAETGVLFVVLIGILLVVKYRKNITSFVSSKGP